MYSYYPRGCGYGGYGCSYPRTYPVPYFIPYPAPYMVPVPYFNGLGSQNISQQLVNWGAISGPSTMSAINNFGF